MYSRPAPGLRPERRPRPHRRRPRPGPTVAGRTRPAAGRTPPGDCRVGVDARGGPRVWPDPAETPQRVARQSTAISAGVERSHGRSGSQRVGGRSRGEEALVRAGPPVGPRRSEERRLPKPLERSGPSALQTRRHRAASLFSSGLAPAARSPWLRSYPRSRGRRAEGDGVGGGGPRARRGRRRRGRDLRGGTGRDGAPSGSATGASPGWRRGRGKRRGLVGQ